MLVNGDKDYGTEDFCVMKYEAKNNGSNVAVSQAANSPWVSISSEAARTRCTAMGPGYNLIANHEWMTIGANVAAINGNWTGGTVGSGSLFAGHIDSNPNSACAASANDSLFFVESSCTPASSGDTAEQRRTHTLSNGSVLWDLSGNVWDAIAAVNKRDKPGATSAWYEYSSLTGTKTTAVKDLVPTHAVKAFWSDSWTSANYIGALFPGGNVSGGGFLRGGDWNAGSVGGVFQTYLDVSPTFTGSNVGFRCIYNSP